MTTQEKLAEENEIKNIKKEALAIIDSFYNNPIINLSWEHSVECALVLCNKMLSSESIELLDYSLNCKQIDYLNKVKSEIDKMKLPIPK